MSLFSAESITFETPIAMLMACHDRVRQYAELTLKLAQYLIKEGVDSKAQDAAASILRYFDVAHRCTTKMKISICFRCSAITAMLSCKPLLHRSVQSTKHLHCFGRIYAAI
ncbi:Uncharacterised protein [Iodobacter fluviatilis]|uniref:Uncharacterized protein n=1 Tax=Iodobacter fluviatilis TaxID=537 RepID=A0A377SR73_9NEIS|nr:Uncharacterised protein [Iodobacter fluviatilis]